MLAGCGVGTVSTVVPEQMLTVRGTVHGGQSPVAGAHIALYLAGNTGNGSAVQKNLLNSAVTSDSNGQFTLTGLYGPANAADQVYIVATGGNPGLSGNTTNSSLAMVTALGNFGDLTASTTIQINEMTTVAAAYALAPFAAGVDHIGASGTNATGLANAMANAKLLADPAAGYLANLPATQVVEGQKVLALADVIATCVNSDGGTPCSTLYSNLAPLNGAAPVDTFQAALSIARNPTVNVTPIFGLIGGNAPFPTALTAAPNDWTISMTLTGAGLSSPTALGVDGGGNVWVADYNGGLSGFTPQGVALNAAGYNPPGWLSEVFTLAIDTHGDVWMTNEEKPVHRSSSSVPYSKGTLVKFQGVPSGSPGTPVNWYFDDTVDYPEALATDSNGWVLTASRNKSVFSIYNVADGSAVGTGLGAGAAVSAPMGLVTDATHGVWLANSNNSLAAHFGISTATSPATATLISDPSCCNGANAVAVDAAGNAWYSNYGNSSISEVSPGGVVLLNSITPPTVAAPSGLTIDGAGNVWVPNFVGSGTPNSGITELAGYTAGANAGTPQTQTPIGLDVSLLQPFAAQADASGNLWVTSEKNDSVVVFFGLASPTKTPAMGPAQAP